MRRRVTALWMLAAGTLAAQTAITNASVSGMVKDSVTGKPLANYVVATQVGSTWVGDTVVQSAKTKDVESTTDSSGRYKLTDLPPGQYRISAQDAQRPGPSGLSRRVSVNGSDLENIDFRVVLDGSITGRVLDENKEPVPDVMVRLITREYFMGNLGYYFAAFGGRTNDRGEYTVGNVKPGQSYLVMAERVQMNLPAHSEAPLDPKLRKRVPERTWYPSSPSRDGAVAMVLRPGEKREGVDIEMKKSASYCLEGLAIGAAGGPMRFSIEPTQPSSGVSNGRGTFVASASGLSEADGKFRICDLYPGTYRLSAMDRDMSQTAPHFGVTDVTIADEDLRGINVPALPGKSMDVEVAWDVDPPSPPIANKISVSLDPMFRAGFMNERGGARLDIPGVGTLDNVFPDDYRLRTFINAPGVYIKEVTFGGRSVMYEPLRAGVAMGGTGVRVVLAHDGSTLNAQVTDKDGNPGANLKVLVFPAEVRSEGELSARIVQGQTNQLGAYTSQTLPPGKYFVAATEENVDATPESVGKLWRTRSRFQDVDLPPAGSASVKLEPVTIR